MSECTTVGLTPTVLARYADQAENYLGKGHLPPADFTEDDVRAAAQQVRTSVDRVCADPRLAAQAAVVIGYVEEVTSIDPSVSFAKRRQGVRRDQTNFDVAATLGAAAGGVWKDRLAALRRDVEFVTDQFYGDHDWAARPVPSDQPVILRNVLQQVSDLRADGKQPMVVVDLDDTVLNPAVRTKRIIDEFTTTNPGALLPNELSCIWTVGPELIGYSATTDLEVRCGVSEKTYLDGLQASWWTKFFSNEYVKDDGMYPGASQYVEQLRQAGAVIVYLTGRHLKGTKPGTEGGMKEGTLASLRRHGFPMPGTDNVQIIMKPDFDMKDLDYKKGLLPQLEALGTPVAVFDNEPKIDNMFMTAWPNATIVRIGRVRGHNPPTVDRPDGTKGAPRLQDIPRVDSRVVWIQDFRTTIDQAVR